MVISVKIRVQVSKQSYLTSPAKMAACLLLTLGHISVSGQLLAVLKYMSVSFNVQVDLVVVVVVVTGLLSILTYSNLIVFTQMTATS